MSLPHPPLRIGVDIGGTFTDLVVIGADGHIVTHKTPSEPADPAAALFRGLDEIAAKLGLNAHTLCSQTAHFVHGTTVATNTLLERTGARTGLLVTAGFRDSLELRRGYRDNPWDHRTPWAPVLVPRYLRRTVRGRISPAGEVIEPLDHSDLQAAAALFRREAVQAVAICFLHSYCNPSHEREAQEALQRLLPDTFVSASHEVAPLVGEFERSSTVAVNAYIADKTLPYLRRVRDRLRALGLSSDPHFVQSTGGVISFEQLHPRPVVLALSGPAAGASSLRAYSESVAGCDVVSIEVGGTSCDVTVMEGASVAERTEFRIGEDVIALPSVDIHTVAIGGGTIAGVDSSGMLFVGPRGAGARPGPAAFGLGGLEPTMTDAHIVLGRLRSGRYAGGAISLSRQLAQEAITRAVAEPLGLTVAEAAIAIVRLGEQQIRHAVERVTLERGHDPSKTVLLAGGGAGPLHAASVARNLGCRRVFVPRLAGVFCAFGMCNAEVRHDWVKEIGQELSPGALAQISGALESLRSDALRRFEAGQELRFTSIVDLRYIGSSQPLGVRLDLLTAAALRELFEARHLREFGFIQPGGAIEAVAVRLTATASLGNTSLAQYPGGAVPLGANEASRVWISPSAGFCSVPVFDGSALRAGTELTGPALIEDTAATTLVGAGDRVRVDAGGNLHIEIGGGHS